MSSLIWRKSSYSGSGEACVEVAHLPARVAVRDAKNPDGPMLVVDQLAIVRAAAIPHPPRSR